jgi:hypothetical protein
VAPPNGITSLTHSRDHQFGGMIWPHLNNKTNMVGFYLLAKKPPPVINGPLLQSLVNPAAPIPNKVFPALVGYQRHTIDYLVQHTFVRASELV